MTRRTLFGLANSFNNLAWVTSHTLLDGPKKLTVNSSNFPHPISASAMARFKALKGRLGMTPERLLTNSVEQDFEGREGYATTQRPNTASLTNGAHWTSRCAIVGAA